jgi:hypothetical protein
MAVILAIGQSHRLFQSLISLVMGHIINEPISCECTYSIGSVNRGRNGGYD